MMPIMLRVFAMLTAFPLAVTAQIQTNLLTNGNFNSPLGGDWTAWSSGPSTGLALIIWGIAAMMERRIWRLAKWGSPAADTGEFTRWRPPSRTPLIRFQMSSNLVEWAPWQTNSPVNGVFTLYDTNTASPQRFYRIRQ